MSFLVCVDCGDVVHYDLFPCGKCAFGPCNSSLCDLISEKLKDTGSGICDSCHEERKSCFLKMAHLVHALEISRMRRKRIEVYRVSALVKRLELSDQRESIRALLGQVRFVDDSGDHIRVKGKGFDSYEIKTKTVLRNHSGSKGFSYKNR